MLSHKQVCNCYAIEQGFISHDTFKAQFDKLLFDESGAGKARYSEICCKFNWSSVVGVVLLAQLQFAGNGTNRLLCFCRWPASKNCF